MSATHVQANLNKITTNDVHTSQTANNLNSLNRGQTSNFRCAYYYIDQSVIGPCPF